MTKNDEKDLGMEKPRLWGMPRDKAISAILLPPLALLVATDGDIPKSVRAIFGAWFALFVGAMIMLEDPARTSDGNENSSTATNAAASTRDYRVRLDDTGCPDGAYTPGMAAGEVYVWASERGHDLNDAHAQCQACDDGTRAVLLREGLFEQASSTALQDACTELYTRYRASPGVYRALGQR
jgi:hypothetical protein